MTISKAFIVAFSSDKPGLVEQKISQLGDGKFVKLASGLVALEYKGSEGAGAIMFALDPLTTEHLMVFRVRSAVWKTLPAERNAAIKQILEIS